MGRLLGRSEKRSGGWIPDPPVPAYPGASNDNYMTAESGDLAAPAVWACVSLISNSVSMMALETFQRKNGIDVLCDSPKLITRPSDGLTTSEFVHQVMVSLLLRGNGYGRIVSLDKNGYPDQIELLHPDTVTVRRNSETKKIEYKIDLHGKWLTSKDIWHIKGLTLPGGITGVSPVGMAAMTIGVDTQSRKFASDFFNGSAIPKAVLESDQPIDQVQAQTMKDRLKASLIGNRDPLILGLGLKYVPLTLKPDEAQFIQTQNLSVQQICRFFNVPSEMIGAATSGGSITYANVEQRGIDFLTYTISFWLKRIEDSMYGLLPDSQFVQFRRKDITRTDAETTAAVHIQEIAAKLRTPSEIRTQDMNLPPMTKDQKDEVNLVPLDLNVIGGSKLGVKVNSSIEAVNNPGVPNASNTGAPSKAPKGEESK